MLRRRSHTRGGHQQNAARQSGKHHPARRRSHRVAMKTMAKSEAIAIMLQKICMAQKQCRQNSSIQTMTSPALPMIT
jgi:hypothetical protein